MNFGWLTPHTPDDELARVVIHEFGHALGCLHEHQNPEGGIQWNIPGVYIYNRSKQWSDSQIVQYSGSVGY